MECVICAYIYEQSLGDTVNGIAPGTSWDKIEASWVCPDCGASKCYFEKF